MSSNTPTLTSYEESIAPWNDPIDNEEEFDFVGTQIMVCRAKSKGYNQEDACDTFFDEHHTITELLNELRTYVMQDIAMTGSSTGKGAYLKRLLADIDTWELEESNVEEV